MKRAAIYMRVSTVDQHPESQLLDLEAMAQQRGLEVVQRYTDRITGTRARRPGLDQMMADARRGQFDVVLVWAGDRAGAQRAALSGSAGRAQSPWRRVRQLPRATRYRRRARSRRRRHHRSNRRVGTQS